MSRPRLTKLAAAALSVSILHGVCHDALAGQTRRLPRRSQPVSPARAAPDVTSTIPAQKTQAPPADDETLPKPFDFPAAPRGRMRACGEKWQVIKMSGQAADQTWRDFATKCLVERDEPRKTSP